MTLATNTNKAGPYLTNGLTVQFPFNFLIFKTSELVVYKENITTGENTTLTLDTDYIVSSINDPSGGYVQISPALPEGYKIVILREVEFVQEMNLSNQGGFFPEVVEAAFDKLTMMCQQLKELLSRAITVPPTTEEYDNEELYNEFIAIMNDAQETASEARVTLLQYANDLEMAVQRSEAAASTATLVKEFLEDYVDAHALNTVELDLGGRVDGTVRITYGMRV